MAACTGHVLSGIVDLLLLSNLLLVSTAGIVRGSQFGGRVPEAALHGVIFFVQAAVGIRPLGR